MTSYAQVKKALAGVKAPGLFLDLKAFQQNIKWAQSHHGNKTIRVATKSLRSAQLIQRILDSDPVFQGLMTYTLEESLWLRSLGHSDLLLGYPTTDQENLLRLAKEPGGIVLMVDLPEHLTLLEDIAAQAQSSFEVCVDVDLSLDLPGVRFGVYRSSIQNRRDMETFLAALEKCPHLKLVGLMGYEAQIAGVGDKDSVLMRTLKRISLPKLQKRRRELVEAIQGRGHQLRFVNGGGTGSLLDTGTEAVVTEVTVGSGFYCPVLFDNYASFTLRPAMGYTLPVVRRPGPGLFTALGGGYIASGELTLAKQPVPWLPEGIELLKHEGAGEVQTPFKYSGPDSLSLGDFIVLRHAKAGEPCERFSEIHLIEGDTYKGSVPTYRGDGKCFL